MISFEYQLDFGCLSLMFLFVRVLLDRSPSSMHRSDDIAPDMPEVLGVSLRSGSLRLYTPEAEQLIAKWRENWPFSDLRLLGERWVQPDMEDVFTAYSQGYDGVLKRSDS